MAAILTFDYWPLLLLFFNLKFSAVFNFYLAFQSIWYQTCHVLLNLNWLPHFVPELWRPYWKLRHFWSIIFKKWFFSSKCIHCSAFQSIWYQTRHVLLNFYWFSNFVPELDGHVENDVITKNRLDERFHFFSKNSF